MATPSSSSNPTLDSSSSFQWTQDHLQVLTLFEKQQHILVTGSAGTGKSTLLREIIKRCDVPPLQWAATGTAALQLQNGRTIHSVLRLPVGAYLKPSEIKTLYETVITKVAMPKAKSKSSKKKADDLTWVEQIQVANTLIVDEISMVSQWMLEVMDLVLRIIRDDGRPMGGLHVVFVGDFLQLPPVFVRSDANVPPEQGNMAFESPLWKEMKVQSVWLGKKFRQRDALFASVLEQIRNGIKPTDPLFADILKRAAPAANERCLWICAKRADVQKRNSNEFKRLHDHVGAENLDAGGLQVYSFPLACVSQDEREKQDLEKNVREHLTLEGKASTQTLMIGMRVMLIRNMQLGVHRVVNGDTGTIVGFERPSDIVVKTAKALESKKAAANSQVSSLASLMGIDRFARTWFPLVSFDRLNHADALLVMPASWTRQRYTQGRMQTTTELLAVPLIAAWAMTAHRAQGATIANIPVHICADGMQFMEGTFYVAISRCCESSQVSVSSYRGFCQNQKAIKYYAAASSQPNTANGSSDDVKMDDGNAGSSSSSLSSCVPLFLPAKGLEDVLLPALGAAVQEHGTAAVVQFLGKWVKDQRNNQTNPHA